MKIGIFWIYNDMIYIKSDTSEQHRSNDNVCDIPTAHYDYWTVLQKQHKHFRRLGYDEVPRGRILKKKNIYIAYSSDAVLASASNRALIEKAFEKGSSDKVQFVQDEHYEDIKHLGFENFE